MRLYRKIHNIKVSDIITYQLFNLFSPTITFSKLSQIYKELNYGPNTFQKFTHRSHGIEYINQLQSITKFSLLSLHDYILTLPQEIQNQFFHNENPTLESQIKQDYTNYIESKYPPFISYNHKPKNYTINFNTILSHLNSLSPSQLLALSNLFTQF
jgi:hypothetical protein